MKYIKTYESMLGNDYYTMQLKRLGIKDFINHDMISDIKDLSMDLFDQNITLVILIRISSINSKLRFGEIYLDHSEDYYNPILLNYNADIKGDIIYNCTFMNSAISTKNGLINNKEEINEVFRRIMDMYPNETIINTHKL